jgi:Flp pilus assembly protein TadB
MAATDAVGAVLFGTLYGLAGAEWMSQATFLACLAVLFVLVTTLWVWAEERHRNLPLVRRIGRVLAGLALAFIAVPSLALMPLFWLDTQLPPEAGLRGLLAPFMALLLIALVLVVLVNVVGSVLVAGRAIFGGRAPSGQ